MTQKKKNFMTPENWAILQNISLGVAALMELIELANRSKKFHYTYNIFLVLVIIFAVFCGIRETHLSAIQSQENEFKDSIRNYNNQQYIVNHFNSQRDNISGQLKQLGFKLDITNNRILRINDRVIHDSIYNKMNKVLENSKYNLQGDFN